MACFRTAPSHHLNKCRLIIKGILWHSPESNFTINLICNMHSIITPLKLPPHLPGPNESNKQIWYYIHIVLDQIQTNTDNLPFWFWILIFFLNSNLIKKFDESSLCLNFKSDKITTKFCTWHDSYAVTKIGSDLMTRNWIIVNGTSGVIWIMREK